MSEAEDLCTKAVIMSKGKILEFDYISALRSRHFDCCWVEIEMAESDEQNYQETATSFVKEGVSECGEGNRRKLEVSKQKIRKSEFLSGLIDSKERGTILNFSWIEPRL